MTFQSKVGFTVRFQVPNLDRLIHGPWSEFSQIFGVEGKSHNKMLMFTQDWHLFEIVFKVPYFDFRLVRAWDNVGLCWVHNDGPNEISMGLEFLNFLHGVIVKDPNMEIIGATNNPLFLENKSNCSYGVDGCLNGPDAGLGIWCDVH